MLEELHRLAVQGLIQRLKEPNASASDFATAVKLLISEDVKSDPPAPPSSALSGFAVPSFDDEGEPDTHRAIESHPSN